MLHKLIQRLILGEPLSITMRRHFAFEMKLNQHVIIKLTQLKTVYLCSVLLIMLGCNVSVVYAMVPPSSSYSGNLAKQLLQAHATVDLWNAYKENVTVRKLQTLCIQKTRQSMYSLSDESFQSLPIPPYLQKMLMLKDIVDVLFEGCKMWPKHLPIEHIM